ncbi:MAG: WYL domain-containing protein [Lachnospiraceae bacterium]|jgi:hypothetical protein|nr:WYL domain-containing protein [Lachnospiraceae bacterium]
MLFSEVYSAYFNAVAAIISEALEGGLTAKRMDEIVRKQAFSESVLSIVPALKTGEWALLHPSSGISRDGSFQTPIRHKPRMPLTTLQKRWLKAISLDPRIALFKQASQPLWESEDARTGATHGNGITDSPGSGEDSFTKLLATLHDVEPLFVPEDFVYFDRYTDGDPFTDAGYIERFHTVVAGMKENRCFYIEYRNRVGRLMRGHFIPHRLEYSAKDDKFRLETAGGWHAAYINLARIEVCELTDRRFMPRPKEKGTPDPTGATPAHCRAETPVGETPDPTGATPAHSGGIVPAVPAPIPPKRRMAQVRFTLKNERNALDRVMLHFSDCRKETRRPGDGMYDVELWYETQDETEILIRILSFGPLVQVVSPDSFITLIKKRLAMQQELS